LVKTDPKRDIVRWIYSSLGRELTDSDVDRIMASARAKARNQREYGEASANALRD
jgi:hypothetical protein